MIVFEYLNINLYNYMKLKRKIPFFTPDKLKIITFQMLQGLKYLKNKGVIHCDLKPENVLFADENKTRIKIIDFGASCESCKEGFFYV